jgi:hypothetical protein
MHAYPVPAVEPRRRIRLRGSEAELLADLRSADFQGPLMQQFTDDLWLYGWDVLRGLVRKGTISQVRTGMPHRAFTAADRQTLHDSAELRDGLVMEALAWAIPKFVRLLKRGKWSPEKGASLSSYFTGTCASGFWLAYGRWHDDRVRTLRALEGLTALPEREVPDVTLPSQQRNAIRAILKTASPEQQAICWGVLQDKTQAQIGAELGLSARAVEGRMYQLRTKAWRLVKRGKVDAALVPGSRASLSAIEGE